MGSPWERMHWEYCNADDSRDELDSEEFVLGEVVLVLDELGYLPFAQSGGQLLFHLISRLYETTSIVVPPTSPSVSGRACLPATPR